MSVSLSPVFSSPHSGAIRSDAVASRKAISAAASRLYAERGIDVPFEDIAKEAGVGKSTIYRHFPTREDLFSAIFDDLMDDFARVAESMDPSDPETFLGLFDALLDVQLEHPAVVAEIPKVPLDSPDTLRRRERLIGFFAEPLAAAKQAGVVREELRPEDVRILFTMVCAVVRKQMADSDRARARHLARLSMTP